MRISDWSSDVCSSDLITEAAAEVGPALFLSLLIITFSFIPIFTLEGQEGRLFAPLAFTKTYAMAAAAILSITLVPVLMGWLIRGRIRSEEHTSELQSLMRISYAVFCLKKKKHLTQQQTQQHQYKTRRK